jgi:predicted DsbA family dithiol-disulfide isomerase
MAETLVPAYIYLAPAQETELAQPIRIDFVSDVACPWCVVGLRSLLKAIEATGVKADIHFQPFELNPDMPPEGENTTEHVQKKYGSTAERSTAARQAIKDQGAAYGFDFNYGPESRIWNTFDAHRLLHWAGLEGKQLELKEALFKANFTDQQSTSDHDVLAKAAASAGLDEKRAREILSSGEFTKEVRSDEQLWRNRGIQAVPSIVFNQRWMIQGGQPTQVFEQALRQVMASPAEEARA